MAKIKKSKFLFVLMFACTFLSVCLVYSFFATNTKSQTFADQSSLFTYDTIDNNVLFVSFLDEQEDLQSITPYRSLADTYETFFSSGEHSVKEYYKLNSNNKLTVNTPIIKKANGDLKIFVPQKPRSYYLPYILKKNNKYYTNSNGYFDYYLVNSSSVPKDAYLPAFFDSSTLVARVFNPAGTTIQEDTDISDGIISYSYAIELANRNSNYHVVVSYQRIFREYELLCDIMSQAGEYMNSSTADQNGDRILDCLSLILLDGNLAQVYYGSNSTQYDSYYHNQLVWPHKANFNVMYHNFGIVNPTKKQYYISKFQNMGYSQTDAQLLVGYLYDMPKTNSNLFFDTISISNANVTKLISEQDWENYIANNSTYCHEFGHILGLPDLYIGSNDFSLVGAWSQMCNNPSKNSFFTSYEREKLGWLNSNNIKEITSQGSYLLKKVEGDDKNSVVAYKVKDPTDDSRFLYLEYRNTGGEYFDTACGNTGLLLYTVNTTQSKKGNQGGLPYEIYVQRLSNKNVSSAALTNGQTISNIIFDYGNTNVNSGLTVSVMAVNDDYLVFNISGGELESTERQYTLSDFADNQTVYNKLLQNLPQGINSLSYSCFNQNTVLDLAECDISDLIFLSMFDLSQVEYINLAHNQITNKEMTNFVDSAYFTNNISSSQTKLIVTGNLISLEDLSLLQLNNSHIIWGVQLNNFNYINYQQTTISYYTRSTDIVTLKLDGENLSTLQRTKQVTTYSYHDLVEEINFGSNNTATYHTNFYVINVVSKYPNSNNPYHVCKNDEFLQDISDVITVQGIDQNELQFNYIAPSTQTALDDSFDIQVLYDSNVITTITIYYNIYNYPTVTYNSGKNFYVALDGTFEEKGLTVYQDGQKQSYQMNTSQQNKTYFVKGYYTGVTFDYNYNPNFDNAIKVDEIDTTQLQTYVVWYVLTNQYGRQFDFYNQITITDMYIERSQMNINIYNGLLALTGSNAVVANGFLNYSYINLIGVGANSIRGLELLQYSPNVVVDLSNNNLNDLTELTALLQINPDMTIIVIANKFTRQDISSLDDSIRSKIIFGVQNFTQTIFNNSLEQIYIADYYNDFSSFYTISNNVKNNSTNIYFTDFGQYSVIFTNINNQNKFILACNYFGIINKNTNIIKEYSQQLNNDLSYYFNFYGISQNLLNYSSNIASLELDKIGEKNIIFTISYLNYSQQILQKVTVVDTTKPEITYNFELNVYVTSLQDYYLHFADVNITAHDEYDGDLSVSQSDNLQDDFGEYQVVYMATDSSGNTQTVTRNIFIGNCELSSNNDTINVNGFNPLPISFVVLKEQDFNILYKLHGQDEYTAYTKEQGIICSQLGEFVFDIKLTHKYNTSIVYQFEYSALCKDIQGPTITLSGGEQITILIDASFTEPGITVTDNYTQGVYNLDTHSDKIQISVSYSYTTYDNEQTYVVLAVDTSKVGTYTITYKAVDEFANETTKQRIVKVNYYPVHSLQIDSTDLLSSYSTNSNISLKLNYSPNAIDPNTQITWLVNGEVYTRSTGFSVDLKFTKAGEYIVVAFDEQTNIKSNQIKITVKSNISTYLPIIIVSVVVGCTICACAVLLIKKSKKGKLNVK